MMATTPTTCPCGCGGARVYSHTVEDEIGEYGIVRDVPNPSLPDGGFCGWHCTRAHTTAFALRTVDGGDTEGER